ncbi:MAG: helix-turn-helix transcriptional regulator [Hyphomicrobiaceae bacterium]|nr:helix-turn-helix transcriptional regulator [Hyphomicrobiaceae bacterium]
MGSLMSDAAREAFARRVRLEMAKQGLTRETLAARAEVKERTLGNLLAANAVRDQTVARIARALSIDLDETLGSSHLRAPGGADQNDARADEAYGGYMLSAWESYLGTYLAYRRAFSGKRQLVRTVYEIDWDEEQRRLRFLELQRFRGAGTKAVASSHAGGIYISPHTGLIQLLTTFQGALRLVTLTRFRLGDDKLTGLILTQSDRERYFQPATSPIFLEKLSKPRTIAELERLIGLLGEEDQAYATATAELDRIEREAVFMAARD